MGIGEAEAFSERLKRELLALEAANVHAILESEPLVEEVFSFDLHFTFELKGKSRSMPWKLEQGTITIG